MKGRRLWTKLRAHGAETRVYVVPQARDDEGKKCHATGSTLGLKPEIEVTWVEDQNAMEMALFHELFHEAVKTHSFDARKKAIRGKDEKARSQHEEDIISFWEHPLYVLMKDNGFLRFPKPPKPKG